jgi:hypothetical protein
VLVIAFGCLTQLFSFPLPHHNKGRYLSGGASGLEIISQSEQQRELPEEEPGVKYSIPSFDQVVQKRNTAKEKVRMCTSLSLH